MSDTWRFRDILLAILDLIMMPYEWIISGMEPSFNSIQDAVRRHWCLECILFVNIKSVLGQVGEFKQLYV